MRRDKTGSRTFTGVVPGNRRETDFSLETYLVENPDPATPPAIGPLVESSLGGAPMVFSGGTAGSGSTTWQVVFSSPHNLVQGQGFGYDGEIRFAETIDSANSVTVSAPFSTAPPAGSTLTPAVSYFPAEVLPTSSIFDYWDPETAVQRVVNGASVEQFRVLVNADFHQLNFEGVAQDVLDSVSFVAGQGGLASFPVEPGASAATAPPIPGNLGQAWLGSTATKFLTVASASVAVDNDLDLRNREFGSSVAQCTAPGPRRISVDLDLFEADDEATRGLYASARAETTVQAMFQLGQAPGQLVGVYLPKVVPTVPDFDDSDRVLRWRFSDSLAQGLANDELVVAFG